MVKDASSQHELERYEPGKPVIVIFVCGVCARVYRARQRAHSTTGRFECRACKAIVHEWSGQYDYSSWRHWALPKGRH